MAISRAYRYLGKTPEGYHVYEGVFTFESADTYVRATRVVLTFSGLASVVGVLGLTGIADVANNLGNPVVPVSIATNVVTIMVLESGAAAAGLDEKTNAEAYGVDGSIRCTVYGI